ncbi:MAG: hypothetical protein DRP42_07150, partial [Tenericutes bacterium]
NSEGSAGNDLISLIKYVNSESSTTKNIAWIKQFVKEHGLKRSNSHSKRPSAKTDSKARGNSRIKPETAVFADKELNFLPPDMHHKHGFVSAQWEYRNVNNEIVFYVQRFETTDEETGEVKKTTIPVRPLGKGLKWDWSYPKLEEGFPLYNCQHIKPDSPDNTLVFGEGEKVADHLTKLIKDAGLDDTHVALASAGGSGRLHQSDLSVIDQQTISKIFIFPDEDTPGYKYAGHLIGQCLINNFDPANILIVENSKLGFSKGEDAADYPDFGWAVYESEKAFTPLEEWVKTDAKVRQKLVDDGLFKAASALSEVDFDRQKEDLCRVINISKQTLTKEVKKVRKTSYSDEDSETESSFDSSEDGLFKRDIRITFGQIQVEALARDYDSGDWGAVILWKDADEQLHKRSVSKALFHSGGTELSQMLACEGLQIVAGKEKELVQYLAEANPEQRVIAANHTGWMDKAFILPDMTINNPAGEQIIFQPKGASKYNPKNVSVKGSFDEWKKGMSSASDIIKLVVCASLCPPIKHIVGAESGGIHLYDTTSKGKTTALQAAASVWGNGADSGRVGGNETYIQKWSATANAMEASAQNHNDLPTVIDEIGESDVKGFGNTLYRLFGGTGRNRADRSGNLRESKSWRMFMISVGEIAVSDFICDGNDDRIKGGQQVRLLDIDVDAIGSIFNSSDDVDNMKELCSTHYGHLGREFLKQVDTSFSDWKELDHTLIGRADSKPSIRARNRFVLIYYAGKKAAELGLIPWSEMEVLIAVKSAYFVWESQSKDVSDIDRAIGHIRDFILMHDSRFEHDQKHFGKSIKAVSIPNRVGWYRNNMYHFIPKEFKKACKGTDDRKVKRALNDAGILHKNNGDKLNAKVKIGNANVSVVSLKEEILNDITIC